jgi:hypothetical protein
MHLDSNASNAPGSWDGQPPSATEQPALGVPALAEYSSESLLPTIAETRSAPATRRSDLEFFPSEGPARDGGESVPIVAAAATPWAPERRVRQVAIVACLVLSMAAALMWRSVVRWGAPLPHHAPDIAAVELAQPPRELRPVAPLATEPRASDQGTKPAPLSSKIEAASSRGDGETRASAAPVKMQNPTGSLLRAALPAAAAEPLVSTPVAIEPSGVPSPPADPISAETSIAAATPSAVAPLATSAAPTADIEAVLARYVSAFRNLDAGAVRDVWPSVDASALARAFRGLKQQEMVFDRCNIGATGASAVASCGGNVRYVTRVGGKNPRTELRHWQFNMRRVGERWLIEEVATRSSDSMAGEK